MRETATTCTDGGGIPGHIDGFCTVHQIAWPATRIACNGHVMDGRPCAWIEDAKGVIPERMFTDAVRSRQRWQAEAEALRAALAEVWRRFPEDHANLDLISDEVADLAESVMRGAKNGSTREDTSS